MPGTYQELFGNHDLTALDRHWTKDYIQHNPTMTDGTEGVKQFVEKLGLQNIDVMQAVSADKTNKRSMY